MWVFVVCFVSRVTGSCCFLFLFKFFVVVFEKFEIFLFVYVNAVWEQMSCETISMWPVSLRERERENGSSCDMKNNCI